MSIAIALGGNVGSHAALISRFRAARRLVETLGAYSIRSSRIYESEAVGPVADQPAFLNAVLDFELPTSWMPKAFLLELWQIERALGRRRPSRPKKGPRPIDLDLIEWQALRINSPLLTVPHPRMNERPFVLVPLAEARAHPQPPHNLRAVGPPLT